MRLERGPGLGLVADRLYVPLASQRTAGVAPVETPCGRGKSPTRTMGISLSSLSSHQQGLIDPEARKELGIQTPKERAEKALRGVEALEHTQLCGWLCRNEIEYIHAPCSRRVKDLEPGWEDYTIFYRHLYLLIEIKVSGGVLSPVQEKVHFRHTRKGMPVHVCGGYQDAKFLITKWLMINFRWRPAE